jgi:cyclohexyl-isocyanide hydratase
MSFLTDRVMRHFAVIRSMEAFMTADPFRVGFLLLPNLTQLDLTGPYEVLARVPGAEVSLIWKTLDPVRSDRGMAIVPTATFDSCPSPLDLVCVPGGPAVNTAMLDEDVLGFLRWTAPTARYVTSVCTGSLVLGAAGLLAGRRAACHWTSREFLRSFGAIPVAERVVVDGNVITAGGVTSGIDFGLQVVAEICGRDVAERIQLAMEYDPQPPFDAGSPDRARPAIVAAARADAARMLSERAASVQRAASSVKAA